MARPGLVPVGCLTSLNGSLAPNLATVGLLGVQGIVEPFEETAAKRRSPRFYSILLQPAELRRQMAPSALSQKK